MVLYPKLTRLIVNGREMKPGMALDDRVILENAPARTWRITVDYNQNSLLLFFSGLNFLRPMQTYYRYRVKGLIDDWQVMSFFNSDGMVDEQGILRLPLVGLKPGYYELEMQVSMSPEYWPQDPFVWTVNVEEPWWRTTGLYVLLGLLFAILVIFNFYYYNRNIHLRINLINDEAELQHRIMTYVVRSKSLEDEILTPFSIQKDGSTHVDPVFADIMMKIVPFVQQCREKEVGYSMQQLADVAGVTLQQLYQQLSIHLNESPRLMMLRLRLTKVANMLAETDLPKERIAEELGFVSPNYMIASFFHYYRQTPDDYRNSTAR
jgi:AraC-like DNA-binding protein